jgi:hypothetical protein
MAITPKGVRTLGVICFKTHKNIIRQLSKFPRYFKPLLYPAWFAGAVPLATLPNRLVTVLSDR